MKIDTKPSETHQSQRTVGIPDGSVGFRGMRGQRRKHGVLNILSLEGRLFKTENSA